MVYLARATAVQLTSFLLANMLAVINNTRLRRLPETRRLRQVADSFGFGQGTYCPTMVGAEQEVIGKRRRAGSF